MARLVQRYLDRIREEHAGVTDGALADYIPELAGVDPNRFGMSLSSADGFVYESGDATTEFTIQSISKPFTYALALTTSAPTPSMRESGLSHPARRSTRSASTGRRKSQRIP